MKSFTGSKLTLNDLTTMKQSGEPIACLTAYDASFAGLIDQAMTDVILVGDSLGIVIQGHDSTIPVAINDVIYHCRCVKNALERAYLIADMPFMNCSSKQQIMDSAELLLTEGGAEMIKLEVDDAMLEVVPQLVEQSIPVCAHIGLLPQHEYKQGSLKMKGTSFEAAEHLLRHAKQCVEYGAGLIIAEYIPADLARQIAQEITVPLIGIGAGVHCDGQILVMHDVIGVSEKSPSFAHNFLKDSDSVQSAFVDYVRAVKKRQFPQ